MNNRRGGGMVTERITYSPPPMNTNDVQIPNVISSRRRTISASKLSQIFNSGSNNQRNSSTSLQSGLHELAMTSKLTKKTAETQKKGADALAKWAREAENAAIDDVMQQTSQLFHLFSEKQLQFARDYDHFIQQLQKIADADRAVKDLESKVTTLEEKERKLKRDIRRGVSFFRQKKGGDVCLLRQQLEQVLAAKEEAERTLSDTRAEMEVVKMFRFRHGMQGIADSYRMLAQNCQAIFNCHREITEMVPAISNQDVRRMIYDGSPITRDRVEELRRSLESGMNINYSSHSNSRRRSEPIRNRAQIARQGTPPPPYSPTAPPDLSTAQITQPVQRSHASDSQLIVHQGPTSTVCSTTTITPLRCSPPISQTNHCRGESHRRSTPCTQCGRMYPDLPANPYILMKQQQQIKQRSAKA